MQWTSTSAYRLLTQVVAKTLFNIVSVKSTFVLYTKKHEQMYLNGEKVIVNKECDFLKK